MTDALVHFMPWMRRGLARLVVSPADGDGVPTAALASLTASVALGSEAATREVELRGPGAVVGLARAQIVRRYPTPGTREFERNGFAHVELASPDLPWMFTAASATAERLIPWLVLVVVEEREGVSYTSGDPLAVLRVDEADRELPNLRQAYAWAHVQASVDPGADVGAAFAAHPEAFISRLLCPRRLEVDTWYRACVVPSFEAGRRAGLGEDVGEAGAALAWSGGARDVRLPVYESWRFRTATEPGDFEALVRRMRPRTLDGGVGVHALDIGEPGTDALPRRPGTKTGFVGALVSPTLDTIAWPPQHQLNYERAMRDLVNEGLASGTEPGAGQAYDALRHDPAVGPPAYGALPAGLDHVPGPRARVGPETPKWLAEANLDPAHRAVAGLGAEVVREHQEALMASAWDQAAATREANALLNRTKLALEVGERLAARLAKVEDGRLLQMSRGAHHRIRVAGQATTVRGRLRESEVPDGLASGAFRRRLHAGTTVQKAQDSSRATTTTETTLSGTLTRAFVESTPKMLAYATLTVPFGAVDGSKVEDTQVAPKLVRQADTALRKDIGLGGSSSPTLGPTLRTTSELPKTRSVRSVSSATKAGSISSTGKRLVGDPRLGHGSSGAGDGPGAAAIRELGDIIRKGLDPAALLRVRVRHLIQPSAALGDDDVPARLRVDPQFPAPLYELLVRIDPELLMPGVGTIPTDTVALAHLNPAFVAAFLLGANHELGREFVWREYPAEPGDTWLRTFWNSVDADARSDSGAVEDIPRVASWTPRRLATQTVGDASQFLVLIVKGDLLVRYPNTLIYAVPATWAPVPDAKIFERVEDTAATHLHPSFVGTLGPDVTFLGFRFPNAVEVDAEVVGDPTPEGPNPGWYFVFEELPTEPRFGMDEGHPRAATRVPNRWENLNWYHALGPDARSHVDLTTLPAKIGKTLQRRYDDEGENTWSETWAKDGAAMARITLQRPARVLVHADQMLRPELEVVDAD